MNRQFTPKERDAARKVMHELLKQRKKTSWYPSIRSRERRITRALTILLTPADEICYCGARKSEHDGLLHHGGFIRTGCAQFTWKEDVYA